MTLTVCDMLRIVKAKQKICKGYETSQSSVSRAPIANSRTWESMFQAVNESTINNTPVYRTLKIYGTMRNEMSFCAVRLKLLMINACSALSRTTKNNTAFFHTIKPKHTTHKTLFTLKDKMADESEVDGERGRTMCG